MPTRPPSHLSPMSERQREQERRAIKDQERRGELTPEQAKAALAQLSSPPVLKD